MTPERASEVTGASQCSNVKVGSSLGLRRGLLFPLLLAGGVPIGALWILLFGHPRDLGGLVLTSAGVAVALYLLLFLPYTWLAPFSTATLSPRGIRLRWGPKTRFVAWSSLQGLERFGTLQNWPAIHGWQLIYGRVADHQRVLRITDDPALAILRYPSPPRPALPSPPPLSTTPGYPWNRERVNAADQEWIKANTPIFRWLSFAWIAQFVILVLLNLGRTPPFPVLSWALVAVSIALVTLSVVLRSQFAQFARTFPRAIEIDSEAVTGIYSVRGRKDGSERRVFRTMCFERVEEVKPWRDAVGLTGPPAPAAVFGKFDPDPVNPVLLLRPTRRDRDEAGAGSRDILYLSRNNYEPVRAAWEEWKVGREISVGGLNTLAAGMWMASSEVHRTGPVRLPPPPGG